MFKKVDAALNFKEREKEILEFWKDNRIFERSVDESKGESFSIYDGPPTANGMPHIGHVITRVYKDIFPRYKTMKGYRCERKAGWDTHGLPVELEIEKQLGLDGKKDIEKYGVYEFTKKCRESVYKYKSEWEKLSDRVGYFVDMEHPYATLDNDYIESVWWALKQINDKGLIYKGHKIVPYCPRCGTALSSHEVAQGYKDVVEKSIVARFKTKIESHDAFLLAWTTTPWTLPSNAALCVNPQHEYALIESGEQKFILAKALIENHFEQYKILKTYKGSELEGLCYQPVFSFVQNKYEGKAWSVVCDGFVELTSGTGIVHIAPAFGEDDAQVGRKYGLPFIQLIDERGNFKEEAGELFGIFCKTADKAIIKDLKQRNLLQSELNYQHSYPYCWRCDTPLIYYARESWFIKMSQMRDRLLEINKQINWIPPSIGEGRMGNFLENVVDWAISRERYWGTPLPFWICAKCGKVHAIGSREELGRLGKTTDGKSALELELHKPMIDSVTIKCECGGECARTPEVLDCWFDSGSMPFAQYHYPFENKQTFERNFPADFISEAIDQTRGWFYSLLAISTILFDKAPFKNCIVLGLICDEKGFKMSKSKGNAISPQAILDSTGADAVRWFFAAANAPHLPSKVSLAAVSDCARKFMGTLWNTYAFFALYASVDCFDINKYSLEKLDKQGALSLMDRWILSKLNTLIAKTDKLYSEFNATEAAREIESFVDILSNWYLRRSRDRFWGSEITQDKAAAYVTLHTALTAIAKLCAPITPFLAEKLYQGLIAEQIEKAPISVHLCTFPCADYGRIDSELEQMMERVLDITVLGRAARNAAQIKNRQPLSSLTVASAQKLYLNEQLLNVIKDELNVKSISFIADESDYVTYELKPQLKTLGPKYGAKLALIRQRLAQNAGNIYKALKDTGIYKDEEFELTLEDVLINIKSREGFAAESSKGLMVILDTTLTEDLLQEGFVRELLSRVQAMRKEADYQISDRITVRFECGNKEREIIRAFEETIKNEVLAHTLILGEGSLTNGFTQTADINGCQVLIETTRD